MPSKCVSASMTAVPSTPGIEHATLPQPKKTQVIFLQRSPKLIISRNGGETVQHFVLTQQPIVNVLLSRAKECVQQLRGSLLDTDQIENYSHTQ